MELIVTSGEREEKLEVEAEGAGTFLVHLGSRCYRVDTATTSSGLDSFLIRRSAGDSRAPDGNGPQEQWEVSVRRQAEGDYAVSSAGPLPATAVTVMDPLTHRAREALGAGAAAGAHRINAYMPGRVIALLVEEGVEVAAGQGVLVLEAMKMENEIAAESSG
ncbi:MAG: hypothetical protein KDD47_00905, partial [Acidobacteria bacterium]|nr:hypothetical protein [Acidobacteriota bacterium]